MRYTVVKVIPFAHTLEPEVEFGADERVFVWGSLTLDGIAKERGWIPGCLQNENFDMRVLKEKYGRNFLNEDAEFCTFGELQFTEPMFVRPVHDTKTFTGTVIQPEELIEWKEQVLNLSNTGYSSLRPETPVMFAKPKKVDFEARFFIVDKQVITGSSYRSFGNVVYNRLEGNGLFLAEMDFARQMAWHEIADGYALDIALVDGKPKVIEVNCINSAGFYSCDMNAVVRALEGWDTGNVRQLAWINSQRTILSNDF